MKIVLQAFGNKMHGVMEIPEDTGIRFRLAMAQPVITSSFHGVKTPMNRPIETICEFEWTGATYHQDGHDYHGAREYQLVDIIKR